MQKIFFHALDLCFETLSCGVKLCDPDRAVLYLRE